MGLEQERDAGKKTARTRDNREQLKKEEERKSARSSAHTLKSPDDRKIPSQYESRAVIGTGSYGSVCEAYDHKRAQVVAIKRVGNLFQDLVDCKRILREITILSKLQHPHIVQVYDLVISGNSQNFQELHIIMEICDSDLKRLCRTDVTLTPLHINTLLYNLLVGVNYLHSAGIYHRDLKPANCLVNQDCSVKICDFGLSRAIGDVQEPASSRSHSSPSKMATPLKRTLTGHVVTRWYRAPELILLLENYTDAVDMWSVGCIYAELLGMLEGTRYADRSPLFPGASCFPLSPANKQKDQSASKSDGKRDQLNLIFNLLGTPTEADISRIGDEEMRQYVRWFKPREPQSLSRKWPHVQLDALDLLERLLRFSAGGRPRALQCLEHQLFSEIRMPEKEVIASCAVPVPEFEKEPDLDESLLRQYFCAEVRQYREVLGSKEDRSRHGGA